MKKIVSQLTNIVLYDTLVYLLFFLACAVHQMNIKLSLSVSFSVSTIAYFFHFLDLRRKEEQ